MLLPANATCFVYDQIIRRTSITHDQVNYGNRNWIPISYYWPSSSKKHCHAMAQIIASVETLTAYEAWIY